MPTLSELRAELKELRNSSLGHAPVSRMKKSDVSNQIEMLKRMRAETPAVASVPSAGERVSRSAVETIKEAKRSEFPVMPAPAKKVVGKAAPSAPVKAKVAPARGPEKKKMTKAALREMLDALTSDEE